MISVIVPVYNVEQFLPRCIESILLQTYEDLEIILINDGSTDGSLALCEDYAKKDSRIQVFHQENRGVSSARNLGLLKASGNYIGFVDADDYLHAQMYERLWQRLQATDADIATCSYCFDNNGRITSVKNQKPVDSEAINAEQFLNFVYERDSYKGVSNYLWTKLYKKQLIKNEDNQLKVCFDESLPLGEDNIFNAEMYCKAKKIVYVDEPLYYYVQHENSVMHNPHIQLDTLSILRGYERVIDLYQSNHINEDIIDMVRRFYTYWCGKYLELSIEHNNADTGIRLQEKIKGNFLSYAKTNLDHLERIKWLIDLLQYNFLKGET